MRRNLLTKVAAASATTALAFGAVACEVEDDGMSPGQEDPMLEDPTMNGDGDAGL